MDCGSLRCSFADSSSERDVKKDEKTVVNTGQWSQKTSFMAKNINRYVVIALNGDISRQVCLLAMLTAAADKLGLRLTLHACPSSMAALWASTGLSITLPILPEKSIATREFSDTLRYGEREKREL